MLAVLGKLSKRVLMEGITPCPASTAGFFILYDTIWIKSIGIIIFLKKCWLAGEISKRGFWKEIPEQPAKK